MTMDQAASLRAWALEKTRASQESAGAISSVGVRRRLVVAGLTAAGASQTEKVHDRLQVWESQGYQWVGHCRDWEIIPLTVTATSIDRAQFDCRRWALWVDSDINAFDKGYRTLKLLKDLGGPRQILALHEPGMRRKGLLDNLSVIAASYFDLQLVVLAH